MKKPKLYNKLHSQVGETIAETLVALLIAALALTMLATMISSTVKMVTTSKDRMDTYYSTSVGLGKLELQTTGGTPTTITIATNGQNGSPQLSQSVPVNVFSNAAISSSGKEVYAYSAS